MFDFFNTLLTGTPVKCRHSTFKDVEIFKGFWIRIFGDIEKCSSALIVSHGMGGNRSSQYVVSLVNRFVADPSVALITFDASGTRTNRGTPNIWGVSGDGGGHNNYYDEIIDYIIEKNSTCKIYLSGFSGGAGMIMAYLTCTQGFTPNRNKDRVQHSFLISIHSIEYAPQLTWIRENTHLAKIISFSHGMQGIMFYLYRGNFKKVIKIIKNIHDLKITNHHIAKSGKWYRNNKNDSQNINATVIMSPGDPITKWCYSDNIFSKHYGYNIVEFPGGGHCGFYRIDGTRDHEELIYEYIKKDQGN